MNYNGTTIINGFIYNYQGRPYRYLLMDNESRRILEQVTSGIMSLEDAFFRYTGKLRDDVDSIGLICDKELISIGGTYGTK